MSGFLLNSFIGAAASDSFFNHVNLLLSGDGVNATQNNTFVDSSANNFAITRTGTPTQGSFSPYGNNWSVYFDGTGDYLSVPSNTAFDFSTGDFTVECYANLNSISGLLITAADGTGGLFFGFQSSTLFGYGRSGVGWDYAATVALSSRQWYHLAITRSGTSIRLFIDGQQVGTTQTSSTAYNLGATNLLIGGYVAGSYTTGYISNVRVVKGTALYITNFNPPTGPLGAVGGTSLIACQANRFIDVSTNSFAVTPNGNVSVERFSPFAPEVEYSTAVYGASGYFDGTGDYLSAASNVNLNPGSSAFTFECWLYPTVPWDSSATAGDTLWISEVNTGLQIGRRAGTSQLDWGIAANTVAYRLTSTTLPITGQWNHLVATRSGTGANQAALFLNGTRIAQGTVSDTFVQGTTYFMDGTSTGASETTGYISDMRFVKGAAVYDPAVSTYTVPTAPLTAITNTHLLLGFGNAGIVDSSMINDIETVGNVQLNTTVKKYGTASISFDGTGDYLNIPYNSEIDLLVNRFTIEGWIYPTTVKATGTRILATGGGTAAWNSTTGIHILLQLNSTGALNLQFANGTATPTETTTTETVSANSWTHIAATYNGSNTVTLAINGVLQTFTIGTVARPSSNPSMTVGTLPGEAGNNTYAFQGYIDDLRVTRGVVRYTSTFTPPSEALFRK